MRIEVNHGFGWRLSQHSRWELAVAEADVCARGPVTCPELGSPSVLKYRMVDEAGLVIREYHPCAS